MYTSGMSTVSNYERDDGHCYDDTSKRRGVTITTSLTASAGVLSDNFLESRSERLFQIPISSQINCGIKAKLLGRDVLPIECTTPPAMGAKIPQPSASWFLHPTAKLIVHSLVKTSRPCGFAVSWGDVYSHEHRRNSAPLAPRTVLWLMAPNFEYTLITHHMIEYQDTWFDVK